MQHSGGSPAGPPQHPQRADCPQALPATVHELGESLSAIAAYVETARRLLARQTAQSIDRVAEILDKAAAQTDRAAAVFRQLRALTRSPEEHHRTDGRDVSPGTAACDHAAEGPQTSRPR